MSTLKRDLNAPVQTEAQTTEAQVAEAQVAEAQVAEAQVAEAQATPSSSITPQLTASRKRSPFTSFVMNRLKRKGVVKVNLSLHEEEMTEYIKLYKERFLGTWDIFIIALSLYTLLTLIGLVLFDLSPEYIHLFRILDRVVCVFFLIDFCIRIYSAPNRLKYMKLGWIDLLSSIPQLDSLRWGRTLRLIRIIRAFRSMHFLQKRLENKFQDSYIFVILASFLLTTASAVAVLYLEAQVKSGNIKSAEDALWWAWVTITTVGYGDFYPVTTEGRILAGFLMSAGVGVFGIFTVQCTQYLLSSNQKEEEEVWIEIRREIKEMRSELRALKSELQSQGERDGSQGDQKTTDTQNN